MKIDLKINNAWLIKPTLCVLGFLCVITNAFAKIEGKLTWQTYPVHLTGAEKTAREVKHVIYLSSPLDNWFPDVARHYDEKDEDAKAVGLTQFQSAFNYRLISQTQGVCRLSAFSINSQTTIYLPAIAKGKTINGKVKALFAKEYERIKKHELTHHAYNQQYLQKIDQYLSSAPADRACDSLERTLKDYDDKLKQYSKELHHVFDTAEFKYNVALSKYEAEVARVEAERKRKENVQEGNSSLSGVQSVAMQKLNRMPYYVRALFAMVLLVGVLAGIAAYVVSRRRKKQMNDPQH